MKKTVLALLVLTCTTSAFADDYTDRLTRDYDRRSQTNTSSYGEYDVRSWCARKVEELRRALRVYEQEIGRGRNSSAFAALESGLKSVSQSSFGQDEPFVKMSADSALVIATKLKAAGLSSDVGALNTLEHLVRNTVTVAYQFDTDYYISYVYKHRRNRYDCGESFMEQMQRQALEFADGQLQAALKSTSPVYGQYRPKGDARAFLTAAEVIANNTAYDLRSNIFASEIPCTIVNLGELGADLKAFNRGDRSYFRGPVAAVDAAGHGLQEASSGIQNRNRCY